MPALSKPSANTGGLFDDGDDDDDDDDLFGGSTAKPTLPEAKPASQSQQTSKYVIKSDLFYSYCNICLLSRSRATCAPRNEEFHLIVAICSHTQLLMS